LPAASNERAVADHAPPKAAGVAFTPLDQVLAESDVISLHLPLTNETRNMIGIDELRKMKRTAILINTARGGLVDEQALAQALKQGLIAGAGFDVLSKEPPKKATRCSSCAYPLHSDTPRRLGQRRRHAVSRRSI